MPGPIHVERVGENGSVQLTRVTEYPLLRRLFDQRGFERHQEENQRLLEQLARRGN
jgi:hypothetical protein